MPLVRGQERSVVLEVAGAFGLDVRPTRVLFWLGPERGRTRIVSLGRPPRILRVPRRQRHYAAGPVRVTVLGNPFLTLGQAGVAIARTRRAASGARLTPGRRAPMPPTRRP
jgi:hypothetical protein